MPNVKANYLHTRSITLEIHVFIMTDATVKKCEGAWTPFTTCAFDTTQCDGKTQLNNPLMFVTVCPRRVTKVSHFLTNGISWVSAEPIIANCSTIVDKQAKNSSINSVAIGIYQTKLCKLKLFNNLLSNYRNNWLCFLNRVIALGRPWATKNSNFGRKFSTVFVHLYLFTRNGKKGH